MSGSMPVALEWSLTRKGEPMKIEQVEIGASEAACAIGLSPYKSPATLYAEKLGLIERGRGSEATFLGTHIEHAVVDAFAARNAVSCRRWETVRGVLKPWLRVSPDRVLLSDDLPAPFRREHGLDPGEAMVLEIKTTGLASFKPPSVLAAEWGPEGTDCVPQHYVVQVQLQIAAMHDVLVKSGQGYVNAAILAALIPGRGLVEYVIRRDDDLIAKILDGLERFVHQHLVPEVCPEPTNADEWRAFAEQARKRKATNDILKANKGDDLERLLADYVATDTFLKDAETNKERLRAKIIEAIGENYGIESDKVRATYSAGKQAPRLSTSAFTDEVLALARAEASSEKPERAKLARTILDAAERNTRTAITGRALRVTTKGDV